MGSRMSGWNDNLNKASSSFEAFPRVSSLRGFYFGYYFFAVGHTRLRAAGDRS